MRKEDVVQCVVVCVCVSLCVSVRVKECGKDDCNTTTSVSHSWC
jgi:hypothetical protein